MSLRRSARGKRKVEHIEPVVQILAEFAAFNPFTERHAWGDNQSFGIPFSMAAKKLALERQGKPPHFVEKQGSGFIHLWKKKSSAASSSFSVLQLTCVKGSWLKDDPEWMALANSSLPVPVSPWIRIGWEEAANCIALFFVCKRNRIPRSARRTLWMGTCV